MPRLTPVERNRIWRAKHRGQYNASMKSYRDRHPKVRRDELWNRLRRKVRAFRMLGGKCVICGEDDIRLLVINHLGGLRDKSRRNDGLLRSGQPVYSEVLAGRLDKSKVDLRCYNHNWLYEYERREIWFPEGCPTKVGDFPDVPYQKRETG